MPISERQAKIMAFGQSNFDCLICDGAVRSGKTSIMMLSFVEWAMQHFSGVRLGICGKTIDSAMKNAVEPYTSMKWAQKKYKLELRRGAKELIVSRGKRRNVFEIFGGNDEKSYALIQGRTLAGVLLDEVALMPRSFVEQALLRCSVDGAKLWFNCNPASPQHWFYTEWVSQHEKRNALYLHFTMDDNPGLSEKIKADYRSRFTGIYYERYILGRWVVAEGLIYPMYANTVPVEQRLYTEYYISMDYGILNPTAMILWGQSDGVWYAIREYYHSGRDSHEQKTDAEYYEALKELAGDLQIRRVIIDPSAASFITLVSQKHEFKVWDADNAVLEGIQHVAQCLADGKIRFQECCRNVIAEFGLYRWDEKSAEDKPVKESDHGMDAVRYFVQTAGVWRAPKRRLAGVVD